MELTAVAERLREALNRHDLDAIVDCFDPAVQSELPTQPDRGYRGREQLQAYWQAVLDGGSDLEAKLLRCFADGDGEIACAEWCWHGTRADGSGFARAGVLIYTVRGGRIDWMRLYMEPIQGNEDTVAQWVLNELSMGAVH